MVAIEVGVSGKQETRSQFISESNFLCFPHVPHAFQMFCRDFSYLQTNRPWPSSYWDLMLFSVFALDLALLNIQVVSLLNSPRTRRLVASAPRTFDKIMIVTSVCMSVCLSICLYQSVGLPMCKTLSQRGKHHMILPFNLSLPVCLCLYLYFSVCLSICLSVCLYLC